MSFRGAPEPNTTSPNGTKKGQPTFHGGSSGITDVVNNYLQLWYETLPSYTKVISDGQ